jgi:hypothetical protein
MVWAVLVAVGVAVISMTLFGARLTRRPKADSIVEHLDEPVDPNDPWAAWKPREFEELDRPRPRLWPVGAALTGLVMIGAGFAGARQTLWAAPAEARSGAEAIATPHPYTVQVDIPATPTLKPTPVPTPDPTVAPTALPIVHTATPTQAPSATTAPVADSTAPTLSGSSNCTGGMLHFSYSATAHGSDLSWIAVYVDGKTVKGGPINGPSYSSSWSGPGTHGDHSLEVSVQDKAGHTARKQFQSHCA